MTSPTPGAGRYLAAQMAEDYLRGQILDGFFESGSRVSDVKLSKVLDVGRASVREAILSLSKEGLLEIIPNRGAFVPAFSVDQVLNLFELREALETFAVRLAAKRASALKLNSLSEMLLVSKLSVVKHGGQYPAQLDFHERVVSMSENPEIIARCRAVSSRLIIARRRSGSRPARADEAILEHQEILDALVERNPSRAEAAMRGHLLHASESFLQSLELSDKPPERTSDTHQSKRSVPAKAPTA